MNVTRYIDRGMSLILSARKLYPLGWGDSDELSKLVERTHTFDPEPADIDVEWVDKPTRRNGHTVQNGRFTSPTEDLNLPEATKTARFRIIRPTPPSRASQPSPVCIHLAGTSDTMYFGRQHLATPLAAEHGIASILLENPYYGSRQPKNQSGTNLNTVCDQLKMNIATVEETRSLVRWARRKGHEHIGMTGYSMGGIMSAAAAQQLCPPVAVIPCAAGTEAVHTLVNSPLEKIVDWQALQRETSGDSAARDAFEEFLSHLSLVNQGQLPDASKAVVVGAKHDEFVPPHEVVKLHKHWPGSRLRWLDAGHTTGWFLHQGEIRAAIVEAFEMVTRLPN